MLLVDDHQLVVQLLATALSAEPDLECVGVAHDAAAALAKGRELAPDVVVMDVRLGDGDGIAAARELLAELPQTRVIVLTAFADPRLVQRAAAAGVSALAAKDGQIDGLLQLIRQSVRGSFVSGHGIPQVQQPEHRLAAAGLTADDGAVLRLLAAGLGEDGVASELGVDLRQARRQVQAVLTALGAATAQEAVSTAVARGLLRVGRW
ncbi:response regulator transcription factor [Ornithinimicrobium pekingense]|uniref:DNA-binding response regulator n=1 Tax=Ornithinimicrobium pekingense TaxID=384677 RepID=A0ABQ2FCE6_9MICO|nr:response regulator transcription factor [Ornithinimicrobium pekingense]GGK83400.1 DNA-binding response regulator [Ornithinimicrobium pekingense]